MCVVVAFWCAVYLSVVCFLEWFSAPLAVYGFHIVCSIFFAVFSPIPGTLVRSVSVNVVRSFMVSSFKV
nr:hypothetical protein [uncultured Methanobrevibacter sp.]